MGEKADSPCCISQIEWTPDPEEGQVGLITDIRLSLILRELLTKASSSFSVRPRGQEKDKMEGLEWEKVEGTQSEKGNIFKDSSSYTRGFQHRSWKTSGKVLDREIQE